MEANVRIFVCLLSLVGLMACHSKKADKPATEEPAKQVNFARAVPPAMMTDPRDRANYIVMHFWDQFNFKDTMYCHAPDITEQAFVDFIYMFSHASYETVCEGVKKLMDAAAVDSVMYTYFAGKAEHYLYDPNSQMRNDEFFLPFLEHETNCRWIDYARKVRNDFFLSLVRQNRVNGKANDFTFTTVNGKKSSLYGVSAPYTILVFHIPGCHECEHTINIMKNDAVLEQAIRAGQLKILAVYPDANMEEWHNHKDFIPTTWINAYNEGMAGLEPPIYDFKASPTLYLLDRNKIIILKDTSTGELHDFFCTVEIGIDRRGMI